MTLNKALQRYSWRLAKGTSFQPDENDMKAYDVIAEHIKQTKWPTLSK